MSEVRPGEPWGQPSTGPADVEVHGGDGALAAAVTGHTGLRVRFFPDANSDIARAVGLVAGALSWLGGEATHKAFPIIVTMGPEYAGVGGYERAGVRGRFLRYHV